MPQEDRRDHRLARVNARLHPTDQPLDPGSVVGQNHEPGCTRKSGVVMPCRVVPGPILALAVEPALWRGGAYRRDRRCAAGPAHRLKRQRLSPVGMNLTVALQQAFFREPFQGFIELRCRPGPAYGGGSADGADNRQECVPGHHSRAYQSFQLGERDIRGVKTVELVGRKQQRHRRADPFYDRAEMSSASSARTTSASHALRVRRRRSAQ